MRLVAEHTVHINAPLDVVWRHMVDWENWTKWDTGMERVSFKGPLNMGSTGKLKLRGGPTVPLKVTHFVPGIEYTDEMPLLGSRFSFFHRVVPENVGSSMYFSVHSSGLIATIFSAPIRSQALDKLARWMGNLKHRIESETT